MMRCWLFFVLVFALALPVVADDKPAPDAEQVKGLLGNWKGPPVEAEILTGKKVKGHFTLNVREKGRLFLGFTSEEASGSMSFSYSVKEKDKKRYLVIPGILEKPGDVEVRFELSGDTLKLTAPEKVIVNPLARPADMSGEWKREAEQQK